MKTAILLIAVLLLGGCSKKDVAYSGDMFSFAVIKGDTIALIKQINELSSNKFEPKVYDILIWRKPLDFIKNPVENIRILIVDDETSAVEGNDYSISAKGNVFFPKEEKYFTVQLTIMPAVKTKTIALQLAYDHPQLFLGFDEISGKKINPNPMVKFVIMPFSH